MMVNVIKQVRDKAQELHGGVKYGAEKTMFDMVSRVADIAKAANNPQLEMLALLHKSQERKRIADGKEPLTDPQLEALVGQDNKIVADAIKLLKTEPDDKTQGLQAVVDWAKDLSTNKGDAGKLAAQLLIAEKQANFETSRDTPKPDWPASKHLDYVKTRMEVVEAVKGVSPELYASAKKAAEEATTKLQERSKSALAQVLPILKFMGKEDALMKVMEAQGKVDKKLSGELAVQLGVVTTDQLRTGLRGQASARADAAMSDLEKLFDKDVKPVDKPILKEPKLYPGKLENPKLADAAISAANCAEQFVYIINKLPEQDQAAYKEAAESYAKTANALANGQVPKDWQQTMDDAKVKFLEAAKKPVSQIKTQTIL